MLALLGPLAAFGASLAWAYATARYARASRDVGSVRINLARALTALPVFGLGWLCFGERGQGVSLDRVLWLLLSVVSSYALADSLFLTSTRRAGVTTALSIASTYPLWAALWGALAAGEGLGVQRTGGMVLAVFGVVWLVRLGTAAPTERATRVAARPGAQRHTASSNATTTATTTATATSTTAELGSSQRVSGLVLAGLTSLLWAANSVSVKRAATGIELWQVNTLRYGMGLALLAPQLWLGSSRHLPRTPTGGWLPVLPALVADAVLGSACYVYGLSHTDLAVGATLSSLAPLVSVPIAVLVGEERWSTLRFLAVLVTVVGVVTLVVAPGT